MMWDGQAKKTVMTRFLILFGLVLIADQVSKQIMLDLLFDPPRLIKINLIQITRVKKYPPSIMKTHRPNLLFCALKFAEISSNVRALL